MCRMQYVRSCTVKCYSERRDLRTGAVLKQKVLSECQNGSQSFSLEAILVLLSNLLPRGFLRFTCKGNFIHYKKKLIYGDISRLN